MKPIIVLMLSGLAMMNSGNTLAERSGSPFAVGETLEYDVSWLGITAGNVTLTVTSLDTVSGQEAYRVKLTAETSKGFSNFFKVRDEMISLFTTDEFHSLLYRKKIREGKYRADAEIIYNQAEGFGVYKGKRFEIPKGVRDPICSLYYIRTVDFPKTSEFIMHATADNKTYPIIVKMTGPEKLTIGATKVEAIKVEPLPSLESRLFQKNRSELTIWFSNDERRIPLQILAKVKVGAIRGVLKGF